LEEDRADDRVIVEQAILHVKPEDMAAYEAALRKALPLISATPGVIKLDVRHCFERAGCYLLLVEWEKREDHTIGFRSSDRYLKWRALLHRFYSPFPEVLHFAEAVVSTQ
jgi:heme-degrading monooxygenase HmoA